MPSFARDSFREDKGVKFYTNTRKLAPRMKAYAEADPAGAADRMQRNETFRSEYWGSNSALLDAPKQKQQKKSTGGRRRKAPSNRGPELDTRDLHRIETASDLTGVGHTGRVK